MSARLKAFASYAVPIMIVWVVLQTAYELGYYRGYQRGFFKTASYTLCLIERGNGDKDAGAECRRAKVQS